MKKENEVLKHYKELFNEALNDLKTPGKRHKQIPNILTVLRLLAPAVILPLAITGNIPLTLITAGAFAFTDAVDGFIARHWNLQSELGKDLDAVTDKVFSTTLLAAASVSNPLLLLNIGLEGVIALINTNKKLKGYETASTMTGKLKTWALFGLTVLGIAAPGLNDLGVINLLSVITASLQALTATSYLTQENVKKPYPTPEPPNKKKHSYQTDNHTKKEKKTKDYQMKQEDIKQYQEEDIVAKIEELTQLLQDTHQMEEPQVVNQYIKK